MSRKQLLVILAVIIALQCGTMFYWASHKSSYYLDELLTFEYVQNINNHKDSIEYMDDSSLWKVEEWLSVKDLKTRYTMEEGESVFDLPFSQTIKKFFFDRNYMWTINALETLFGRGGPPKWICICFNIFVWILLQLLLFFFLTSCLALDQRVSLLAVAMWGFCPLALGLSVYCRFYSLTLLLFLVVIVLHKLMWDGTSHKKNILYEVAAILALYLAFKNSELIFVVGGSLVFFFTIGLILRKRYLQSLYYAVPFIGGGLLWVSMNSSLLKIVFHPLRYASGNGAAARLTDYLLNSSWRDKAFSLIHSVKSFAEVVPGSIEVAFVSLLLALVLFFSVRKKYTRSVDGFSLILASAAVVYWLFCVLCGLDQTRYYSFLFLLVFILMWIVFDRMSHCYRFPEIAYKVAFCLVLVGALMPFYRRNVSFVYEWQKPSIERVSENADICSVVNYDPIHNFNVYYSTYLLDESSFIFPICQYPSGECLSVMPDSFLYWATYHWSPSEVLESIKNCGYSTELIYDEGLAMVYLCQKK